MRPILAILGLIFTSVAPAAQQTAPFCADVGAKQVPAQLLPADEASQQPDFFTFRAQLQTAVAARDVDAVVAAADANIKLSFGGDDGAGRLRDRLTAADAIALWRAFAQALALGGAFKGPDSFHAPYYFANWPTGADAFECGVIIGRAVNIRREPRRDATVLASADFTLVRHLVGGVDNLPEGWAAIELSTGVKGYVRSDYLGAPTGLRALFSRVNGRWRLTALVAGD